MYLEDRRVLQRKIILSANRKKISNDWDGVCEITAQVTDENGVLVPTANESHFFPKLPVPGEIAAVDSADKRQPRTAFQASEHHAFEGRCVAFAKANATSGRIEITATSPGLKSVRLVIQVAK